MKTKLFFLMMCLAPSSLFAQDKFDDYFTGAVLRFDYLLAGTNISQRVIEVQQKREPLWGGVTHLQTDDHVMGNYQFSVKDLASQKVIYRQGFSPLFQEWQSTAEAKKMERSFYQVLRFPFPKKSVEIEIDCRNREGQFQSLYKSVINPSNYFISQEAPQSSEVVMLKKSGEPSKKVDIAILAEGYRQEELGKFVKDAGRLTDSLLNMEPYASHRNDFNIYAVKTPSKESGTDIPGRHIYVNTLYNSSFYTFDVARYLTITDLKPVYDQAGAVPYDILIVLVNSTEYGGGGFYNDVCVCTADHFLSPKVFAHEFGHEFAGLGDEYYTSEVAYEDYYNIKIEPWEPNLTSLVDLKSKWFGLIDSKTPVPTARTPEYEGKIGAFEGGGYTAKGIYSPMQDCLMKSNKPNSFCPVCQKAILKAIQNCTD